MSLTEAPPRNKGLSSKASASPTARQYVSFVIETQLLGVPVEMVQEVLNPQAIARTPRAKRQIAGLLNLRGQIVTAVDLRCRLGLAPLAEGKQSMNVIVRHKGEPFSLLVDAVGEVIDVQADSFEDAPHTLDNRWKEVTVGVSRLEDRLFVALNIEAILRLDD